MTEKKYIKFNSREEVVATHDLFFSEFVTEDGINFKNGNQPGTLFYFNPDEWEMAYPVQPEMIEFAQRNEQVAEIIANQVTQEQAIEAGWLPQPINL